MAMVPLLEDSFDITLPLPFDIYDARGMVLARKDYIVPQKLLELRNGLGNAYITETARAAWQKRLVGKVNELIKDPSITLSDIATTIPDQKPLPDEPYASPAQRTVRLTTTTVDDLQELVQRVVYPQADAVAPMLDIARQLQGVVEQNTDFTLLYCHQQLRQKSANWLGALVGQLTLLACRALQSPEALDPLDTLLRKNLLGISLLVVAGMDLHTGLSKRPSQPLAQGQGTTVDQAVSGGLARIQLCAARLCTPDEAASAVRRLEQLYANVIGLLQESMGQSAPQLALAQMHFTRVRTDRSANYLARIRKHYGLFLPGQFVQLANKEVGIVLGYNPTLGIPTVIRVLDAYGLPFSEPLPTRLENPLHKVVAEYASEKVRCQLDYRQILERERR